MYRFDMKQVTKLKFKLDPQESYLEELFLPRYSSKLKYIVNPLLFASCSAAFGLSKAIYRDLGKASTAFRYGTRGLLFSVPYVLVNEMVNGMLIRGYGREQYFYSNSVAVSVCGVSLAAALIPRAKRCKIPLLILDGGTAVVLKQVLDWSFGIYIFFLWNEMFCINRRDLALKRVDNQASKAQVESNAETREEFKKLKSWTTHHNKKSDLDLAPELISKLNREIDDEIKRVNSILKAAESEAKS